MRYAHETAEWPHYRWDHSAFSAQLAGVHFRRGQLVSAMAALGFKLQQETELSVLVQDVVKSSEIEGEKLDAEQVRSSIARRLGFEHAGVPTPTRSVEGVVEMMLDATQHYEASLGAERVWAWHAALFPTRRSGMYKIIVGAWRDDQDGPMQVVSGPMGKERVHYEAPAAHRLDLEMERFFRWFEGESMDPVLHAAIAHHWFVTIHPLDDGNGRIARAIMDMALARADGTTQRFYSMSAQIFADRASYYRVLETTQGMSMDVTPWIKWFLARMDEALASAEGVLSLVRTKQRFWAEFGSRHLNERQLKTIDRLFEGFQGKLTNEKYAKIAKCSHATAWRDLTELVEQGVLRLDDSGGRSTSYSLSVSL